MTSIQRPGGPTGPAGPTGPDDADGPAGASALEGSAAAPQTVGSDAVADLARAVDTGAVAPQAALDQLIDQAVAGLPADQAAELRAVLADAMSHDPYLAGLARELGVAAGPAEKLGGDDPGGSSA